MPEEANEFRFDDLHLGMQEALDWTATGREIETFAALSGDHSPLHANHQFAQDLGYPGRVAHGFLLGAKLSCLIGMRLPGKNSLLVEQNIAFHRPVFAGDQINLSVKIVEQLKEFQFVVLKFRAVKLQDGRHLLIARGEVTCKMLS